MKKTHLIAIAILSAALIVAVWVAGSYFNKARGHEKTVSVVGMAERDFTSDLIVWEFSYSVTNTDRKSGYAQLKEMTDVVKQYLADKGIGDNDMFFRAVENRKETNYVYDRASQTSRDEFVGYRLTQSVRVESEDVDKVSEASCQIPELLDKGLNLEDNSVHYYYTRLSDLKIEMLAEATANARERAEAIAKSAGARLGGLKTANMGVFQITAPNSSDEEYSWGGTFNTSSLQKRATINMRLTYHVR